MSKPREIIKTRSKTKRLTYELRPKKYRKHLEGKKSQNWLNLKLPNTVYELPKKQKVLEKQKKKINIFPNKL